MDSTEFVDIVREIVNEGAQPHYKIGTIASADGKPTITFAGESEPSGKGYTYLTSYNPKTGDRVLLARVKGTYVILGKLAQDESGAVYIVDKGENANGHYIRYSDGRQECWYQDPSLTQANRSSGDIFFEYKEYEYPAPFIEQPMVQGFALRSNGVVWSGVREIYTESCVVYLIGSIETTEGYIGYRAYGRWK